MHRTLVLASASPRRAQLLAAAHLPFTVAPAQCDETAYPGESGLVLARRLASLKATAAPGTTDLVLAADTVVWQPGQPPLGKPRDAAQARTLLQPLLGARHYVTTAWALAGAVPLQVHHQTTTVWFRSLSAAELDAYLATDEWADKAGAYGIQGTASSWVTRLEGSYTNVVGLPVAQVVQQLGRLGIHPLATRSSQGDRS